MITIELNNIINTGYSGYSKLIKFYHEANKYKNQEILICIKNLEWIDANLSALLDAILHKLAHENQLTFTIDSELAQQKFDVLLRNGFFKAPKSSVDIKKTTLPNAQFSVVDKTSYIRYLEDSLMKHRGFPEKLSHLKESIIDQLIEIFCNSHHHSGSEYPFFVSGQYFPKQKCLIFTMVDLGNGFLPKIMQVEPKIKDSLAAIHWAIEGNSTKLKMEEIPGGLGLKGLLQYCSESNGGVQIVSGDGFWDSRDKGSMFSDGRTIENQFVGTTVNLFFKA
jgi:hypothetical protein